MESTMGNPLITIIISAYNVEKYIEKSLISALNQDYPNLEILVVDNASSDKTVFLARKIIDTHKRGDCVRVIQLTENKLISGSRNTGLEQAKGEFLMFMDADDVIDTSSVMTLYNLNINHHADFSFASFVSVNENGKELVQEIFNDSYYCGDSSFDDFARRNVARFPVMTWNKLYRIDFLKRNNIKFLSGSTVDDVYFTFEVLYFAKSFACTGKILYKYLIRQDSVTRSYKNKDFESLLHTNEQINNFIQFHADISALLLEYFVGYLSFFIGQLVISDNSIYYKVGIMKCVSQVIPEYYNRMRKINSGKYRLLLLLLKNNMFFSIILMYNIKLNFRNR